MIKSILLMLLFLFLIGCSPDTNEYYSTVLETKNTQIMVIDDYPRSISIDSAGNIWIYSHNRFGNDPGITSKFLYYRCGGGR